MSFGTPKFCPWCGSTLRMRYPNNDPENGPARLACKDHDQSLQEFAELTKPEFAEELAQYTEDIRTLKMCQDVPSEELADAVIAAAETLRSVMNKFEAGE